MKKILFLFLAFFVVSTMSAMVFTNFSQKEKPKIEISQPVPLVTKVATVQLLNGITDAVIVQKKEHLKSNYFKKVKNVYTVATVRLLKIPKATNINYYQFLSVKPYKQYIKPTIFIKINFKNSYKFNSFMCLPA